MFTYEEYYVGQPWTFFIKKLWRLNNANEPSMVKGKSVLPNGCFNVAVIHGQGVIVCHLGRSIRLKAGVYFCGQMTQALQVTILPFTLATMVQLYPWTPVYFSRADISGYTDAIVPLEQLPLDASQMRQLIYHPSVDYARLCRQVIFTFGPFLQLSADSQLITQSVRLILDTQGKITVATLATTLNCSTRYLQKLFKKHVGLGPKSLALIIKLRAAVDRIAYPEISPASLTQIALEGQFYDQAHFINTFQAIVNTSPKAFLAADYLLSFKP